MVSWVLVVALANLIVAMWNISDRHDQMQILSDSVINSRAEAKAAKTELIDFISRSVQRWQSLADENPQLVVPKISEPQPPGKRKLSESELLPARPKVTPTPVPMATPIRIIRTKRVYITPKPTPYRWPWQDGHKKKTR